jgi:hypothetical protein
MDYFFVLEPKIDLTLFIRFWFFFSDTFIRSEFLCFRSARPSTITTSSFRHGLSGQAALPSSIIQQVQKSYIKSKSEIGQLFKKQLATLNQTEIVEVIQIQIVCLLFHAKIQ